MTSYERATDFTSLEFESTSRRMKHVISEGGAASGLDPLMPKWKTLLSNREIDSVVYFIQKVREENGIRSTSKNQLADSQVRGDG